MFFHCFERGIISVPCQCYGRDFSPPPLLRCSERLLLSLLKTTPRQKGLLTLSPPKSAMPPKLHPRRDGKLFLLSAPRGFRTPQREQFSPSHLSFFLPPSRRNGNGFSPPPQRKASSAALHSFFPVPPRVVSPLCFSERVFCSLLSKAEKIKAEAKPRLM